MSTNAVESSGGDGPAIYVVATCHEGGDMCVRNATAAELADERDEKLTLADEVLS